MPARVGRLRVTPPSPPSTSVRSRGTGGGRRLCGASLSPRVPKIAASFRKKKGSASLPETWLTGGAEHRKARHGTAGRRGRGPEARAACAVPRGRVPRAATACPLPSSRGRGAPSCRGGGSGKPSLPCSPGPACSNGVTGRRLLCDPGKVREVLGAPDRAAAPGHLTGIPVRAWWAPVPTSRTRRPPSAPRPGSPQPATRKPRLSATQGRERWTRP